MGKLGKSAVERAAGEVHRQRERLVQLKADKAAAEAELQSVHQRAGQLVAEDETGEAASRLARSLGELRDRIGVLGAGIVAQEPRVKAAEAAYVEAEADEYEKPLNVARAALTRHQAKTQALLRELEEHEGRFVSEEQYLTDLTREHRRAVEMTPGAPGVGAVIAEYDAPKSAALEAAVWQAERVVSLLRALAAGQQPQVELLSGETFADVYPGCVWGPDALVPAPAYLRAVEAARERLAGLDRQAVELEESIADAEATNARRNGGPLIRFEDKRHRLEQIPAQREAVERDLAALTGEDVAASAAS